MKSVRKAICLVLAVFMVLTLLAACGSPSSNQQSGTPAPTAAPTQASEQASEQPTAAAPKEVTLKVLVDWNGSSSLAAADPVNNPVAKAIKEKTGVTLDVEYDTVPENEKLNLVFASGDMPDIINAPMWGIGDPCTEMLRNAAKQGLLTPLDEYVKDKPLLNDAINGKNSYDSVYKGMASDFTEIILNDPALGGKHYFLPWQQERTAKDVYNWAYNTWCRKDILDALGVNPADVNTSEKLYDLMVKIKAGNFKDANGKPVIPSGGWANGWAYNMFYNSYEDKMLLTDYTMIDGKVVNKVFSPNMEKQILFMRKLVSEKLIDPECFTQNDTTAKEKMAAGTIAIVGMHYDQIPFALTPTLYQSHPEMKYVPVGPIPDANGKVVGGLSLDGRTGSPCLVVTSSCKDPEAAMRFLDYINSDEGLKLICYGIEGTHYTLNDQGKPRLTADWLAKWKADPKNLRNEGIQGVYTYFTILDNRISNWGSRNPGDEDVVDPDKAAATAMTPTQFLSGYRITNFHDAYPDKDKLDSLVNGDLTGTNKAMREKAYFAKSDEEALKILNDYRQQLIKGGIEDYENYLTEKAKSRSDIVY